MKKFSFFITTIATMLIFGVSTLNAAPSTGGGASTKQVKKSTTQKRATSSNKRASANKKATSSKTSSQTRATNKANTPLAQKSKAQLRKEAQQKSFGLMPSELDNMAHNVFHADAAAIKGARDTESALRYLPFVTIINTAGFGQSFDMRGQGRLSANGVKLYINGIVANPVDSYFQPMPIATIIPSLIQEVNVYPGSGAVLYGSGTKGGTINVITSKREAPYFVVGGGYVNTMATEGHSFNAYAHAVENLGAHIKMNAGLAFNQMGGPREDDSQWGGQAILGAEYDIGWGQSISFDVDAFMGKVKTTPYNSLIDEKAVDFIMRNHSPYSANGSGSGVDWRDEINRYACLANAYTNMTLSNGKPLTEACSMTLFNFDPDKEDRAKKGNGEIETSNMRITGDVVWNSQVTQNLAFEVKGFYHLSQLKYDKYKMNLPYFVLGYIDYTKPASEGYPYKGYNWFLPRPTDQSNDSSGLYLWNEGDRADGERTDWHYFDQSGSSFSENKFGIRASMDWKHGNGEFIFGVSSNYETNNKKQNSHLRQAIADGEIYNRPGNLQGGDPANAGLTHKSSEFRTLIVDIQDRTDIKAMTNAVFVLENYRFNRYLSLMAGARYEMKNYDVSISDKFDGVKLQFNKNKTTGETVNTPVDFSDYGVVASDQNEFKGSYKENFDNFTFEVSPVLSYSNTGSVYLRGEMGYVAPPAWAMLRRIGYIEGAQIQQDIFNPDLKFHFTFVPTELKSETYWTAELGWKELIGTRRIPLGFTDFNINALLFSANVFYTDSSNEFYFNGDTWSGMELGNYDKSRRMGAEVALEQYLFNGALGFNESFTYLKAQQKPKGGDWQTIPYTYDFKATFGANINISHYLEIIDVSVGVWLQNSLYGGQTIYSTDIAVLRGSNTASVDNPSQFRVVNVDNTKLDPYIISDFGVSVGLNKNAAIITVGIKNIFDTFYYDYYNNDRSAVVNENRYIIGRGRTVFIEGQYKY